ncbi:hypothetical protein PT7_0235 [Pusillimonas sp. T7-7]|uniref:antirestriction protein n=1 Tax=Pusillimonas sp. (strain T7-7) TaxID=1007105 RepID=UPI00020849A2|nr:antirestriction protein [Pusillimonas sp. T7-7]AEC18775.1 hypothetical protein PT7_0235 [Pusillimonas sp. T7-7]
MSTQSTEPTIITAARVCEAQRLNFLPTMFGKHFIRGEALVYHWLGQLCSQYSGGYWHFYTLSNGSFYLAPDLDHSLPIVGPDNWFDSEVSPDAAGVIATLFALCSLANETCDDAIIERYHSLRDYISFHPEGSLIYGAID